MRVDVEPAKFHEMFLLFRETKRIQNIVILSSERDLYDKIQDRHKIVAVRMSDLREMGVTLSRAITMKNKWYD